MLWQRWRHHFASEAHNQLLEEFYTFLNPKSALLTALAQKVPY